jgi:hypothetical protein
VDEKKARQNAWKKGNEIKEQKGQRVYGRKMRRRGQTFIRTMKGRKALGGRGHN